MSENKLENIEPYFYECCKCDNIIIGNPNNPSLDEVVMKKEKENLPIWIFMCFRCHDQAPIN